MALQSVAWIGMVANYARDEKLVVAIEKTFDGQHPCRLCEAVKSGRAEEQKNQVVKIMVKIDAVLAVNVRMPEPQVFDLDYSGCAPMLVARSEAPAIPPPRTA